MEECARFGLSLRLHACSGWSCAGGPWVQPEVLLKKLVLTRESVEGGKGIERRLPQPTVTKVQPSANIDPDEPAIEAPRAGTHRLRATLPRRGGSGVSRVRAVASRG